MLHCTISVRMISSQTFQNTYIVLTSLSIQILFDKIFIYFILNIGHFKLQNVLSIFLILLNIIITKLFTIRYSFEYFLDSSRRFREVANVK